MKKIFALLAIFSVLPAFSQDEPTNPHQLGINATLFIKQFLAFNNNTLATNNPYLVTYKHINNARGLRAGVGFSYSGSSSNPNSGSPLTTTSNMTVNARLGYEWQKNLSKHWLLYYGADVTYDYLLSRVKAASTSGFPPQQVEVTTENENYGFGAGPVLGIEFRLGKSISFNAEANCYYKYTEMRRRESNSQFPTFSVNQFTARNSIDLIVPTSLFFVLKF